MANTPWGADLVNHLLYLIYMELNPLLSEVYGEPVNVFEKEEFRSLFQEAGTYTEYMVPIYDGPFPGLYFKRLYILSKNYLYISMIF